MKSVRDIVKFHSDMGLSIRKIQGATGVTKNLSPSFEEEIIEGLIFIS